MPPGPLVDFGISRVATYHYMLATSGAPLLLLMNCKVFDNLPKPAQDLIRKYSGRWAADRFIETYDEVERAVVRQLEADPRRRVTIPSPRDLATARVAFTSVLDEWVANSPHNRVLLKAAEAELGKLRAGH